MVHLATEYTDVKDVKHRVEHFLVPADERNSREQLAEDVANALTKPGERVPP